MPQQKSLIQPGEWPTLAGFRFILALFVLVGHASGFFIPSTASLQSLALGGPSPAVLAFFVVSGYSIAASAACHPDYYKRRAVRILPVYSLCLAVAVAVMFTWPQHGGIAKKMLLVNMLFLQGVFGIPAYYGFGQSWTLVCEVAYYSVAPILNRLKTPLFLAVAALSVAAYAWVLARPCYFPTLPAAEAIVALAWAWLLGFFYYKNRTRLWARRLFLIGYPLIGFGALLASFRLIGVGRILLGFRLVGIGGLLCCVLLLLAVPAIFIAAPRLRPSPKVSRILNYLGDLSYPLYLVHLPLFTALSLNHAANGWTAAALALLAAVIINAIDQPLQRRRKGSYRAIDQQCKPRTLTRV